MLTKKYIGWNRETGLIFKDNQPDLSIYYFDGYIY